MRRILKLTNRLKKLRNFKKGLEFSRKTKETEENIEKCLFCRDQKQKIKECCQKHNVKENVKSVMFHIVKCSDCRSRLNLIKDCKKAGHK